MSESSELGASTSPERDARALRDAAAGELALRFPSRWLEEHTVLPLSLGDGVAEVAADGAISAVVSDVLTRALRARIVVRPFAGADIRAALVANPRHDVGSARGASPSSNRACRGLSSLVGPASAGLAAGAGPTAPPVGRAAWFTAGV